MRLLDALDELRGGYPGGWKQYARGLPRNATVRPGQRIEVQPVDWEFPTLADLGNELRELLLGIAFRIWGRQG